MKVHKIAAIDIGSNSVRLLVSNVIESEETILFKKSSLTRLPIRLGPDAFEKGKISKANTKKLITGMKAYSRIMDVHEVEHYRACATSALREAENGPKVVTKIREATGIEIELISGKEEAAIIFSPEMLGNLTTAAETFLYVDVGGGSTELTLFNKGEIIASQSFKIGTIRLLKNLVTSKVWSEMEHWITENVADKKNVLTVGSGGNINRVFKLSGRKIGSTLSVQYLRKLYRDLEPLSTDERMVRYDLNPDRADVLPHALSIFTRAMKCADSDKVLIPKKGLSDGIVRQLFAQNYANQKTE